MHCFHPINSTTWARCPKCGKMVRVNKAHLRIYRFSLFLAGLFAPFFTDWVSSIFAIENYVSSKYIRLGMGVLFMLFVGVLISIIFPLYEVKPTDE